MANDKWFMHSIEQTLTATGYIIVITTDIPCHLWMRYTTIEPKEHMIPVLRRGVPFRSDKYFCFDVYHDNEQEEAGDTLEHTFVKEPWPSCETRWFYFHGEISGTPSPSTTTIFKKHRFAPPLPPEPQLFEHYITGNDSFTLIYGDGWFAQTFTPSTAHKITSVKLKLCRKNFPGTVTVSIRATDGAGHPTGPDLCSGTTDGDTLPSFFTWEWREITLGAGSNLNATTKYAIVVRCVGDGNNLILWATDISAPTYLGGWLERSLDAGVTWNSEVLYDLLFEEWGVI